MRNEIIKDHECTHCNNIIDTNSPEAFVICSVCGSPMCASCVVEVLLDAEDNNEFAMLRAFDPNDNNMDESEYLDTLKSYALVNDDGYLKAEYCSYACNVCNGSKTKLSSVLNLYEAYTSFSPEFMAYRLTKTALDEKIPHGVLFGKHTKLIEASIKHLSDTQSDYLEIIEQQANRIKELENGGSHDDTSTNDS